MPNTASPMVNPQAMMSNLMEQMGQNDPAMMMMMQMMQNQQSTGDDEDEVQTAKELEVRLSETERELGIVRAEAKKLLAAHRGAIERLGDLSAALGACGICWGDDPDCAGCHGRGHIGMIRPDLQIRARLLGPARSDIHPAEHSQNDELQRRSDDDV